MKIAVLGGGLTGLTASYLLAKEGHTVVLYEKSHRLGGLAAGFKQAGWEWYVDYAYHHLFTNDHDIISFAREIEFDGIEVKKPVTASLFYENGEFEIYPFDTPLDLMNFPYLTSAQKLRTGAVLAWFKAGPLLPAYETRTAKELLEKTMGKDVWNILWRGLFHKKFGKYAENILASFIWARIKKRTKHLAYIRGGFQAFVDYIEAACCLKDVDIRLGAEVTLLQKSSKGGFRVNGASYEVVISTLPSPVLARLGIEVLPRSYLHHLSKIKYLHATNLIIESEEKLLDTTYWLNVVTDKMPIMVVVQQTNIADRKHYGNKHIAYIGNYVDSDSLLLKMGQQEALDYYLPYLQRIQKKDIKITNFWYFKTPWAQPITDKEYPTLKPDFVSPTKNFLLANLDMTYPFDRGTNYAVKLGREVSRLI